MVATRGPPRKILSGLGWPWDDASCLVSTPLVCLLVPLCCPSASAHSLFPTVMVLMGLTDHCYHHKSDCTLSFTEPPAPLDLDWNYIDIGEGLYFFMQRDQSIAIKGDGEKNIFYTRTWNRGS